MRRGTLAGIALAVIALGIAASYFLGRSDDAAAIRQRLRSFASEINSSTLDGRGPEARAAQLASYLTEEIDVDLGHGSAPIRGRATVLGMAERLQPRTAAFRLEFEDVNVTVNPDGEIADVELTAKITRRSITTSEQSLDAREFALGMRKIQGEWKIDRVRAIDVLK